MTKEETLENTPTVDTPTKRTDKHTETHECDYISRQAAIEEIHKGLLELFDYVEDVEEPFTYTDIKLLEANKKLTDRIRKLPSERSKGWMI